MNRRLLLLLAVICVARPADACSIPVFRYALEHWEPDPFMVAVFYRGELTEEQIAALEELDAHDSAGEPTANVMVKAIDVDQEIDTSLRELWELQQTDTLPWMAVHAPARSGPPQRIWGGALTAEVARAMRDSPARQEVADRLIAGDSVVWVLVESGDPAADDAAYDLLSSRLAELQETLRLPEIEEADFGDLSVVPEALRMSFSVIRISRDDPQESQFVVMLEHAGGGTAADDAEVVPVAVPVFGRGRAFDGLVGEDLNSRTIEDACRFLTGACQCTVKSQNPGLDLLMAVDWGARIEPAMVADTQPPTLVGLAEFSAARDTSRETAVENPAAAPAESVSAAPVSQTETSKMEDQDLNRAADASNSEERVSPGGSAVRRDDVSMQSTTLLVLAAMVGAVVCGTLFVFVRSR